jgi:hypothetical protein
MSNEQPKLEESLNEAEWAWVKPHVLRDAVILVGKEIEILRVGKEMAANNSPQIQEWIQKGILGKPTAKQVVDWDSETGKLFLSLIVAPYVLIQEIQFN